MGYQSQTRPPFVDPIPEPNTQVRRLMLATSMLIDGYLDTEPQHFHPHLQNCMLVPQAGIIIAGTRCPRPLMTREVTGVGKAVERDAIVVRFNDNDPHIHAIVLLRQVNQRGWGAYDRVLASDRGQLEIYAAWLSFKKQWALEWPVGLIEMPM